MSKPNAAHDDGGATPAHLKVITDRLVASIRPLSFGAPVTHVYNPLEYARASYDQYLETYGQGPKEVLLMGMNPGPWGMAQTGVPFGELKLVREWLQIEAPVEKPSQEHPKRPIMGFECHRREVSGRRVWGWVRESFGTPQRFFDRFFVYNYCPLMFLEESGRNRTPDKLRKAESKPLLDACDRALAETVAALKVQWVIGVGKFAEVRAEQVLAGADVNIGRILHPSPANPQANKGWAELVARQLADLGIRVG